MPSVTFLEHDCFFSFLLSSFFFFLISPSLIHQHHHRHLLVFLFSPPLFSTSTFLGRNERWRRPSRGPRVAVPCATAPVCACARPQPRRAHPRHAALCAPLPASRRGRPRSLPHTGPFSFFSLDFTTPFKTHRTLNISQLLFACGPGCRRLCGRWRTWRCSGCTR